MFGSRNGVIPLLCSIALSVIFVAGNAFGAATGKIAGTITDKSTGDPVIGASVTILGTNRGAMTDLDGDYVIPQIAPGTYTLRVSHLDYATVEITDVEVKADITSNQSIALQEEATELQTTITVKGERDQLDIYQTSNTQIIDKETIQRQPVTQVDDLIDQVAGVQQDREGQIFIRGGRAGEVSYIVDGVPMDDPLGGGTGGARLSLVSGSIQELQVIKDGFDPEYGNALSGIIKITTQTGSRDNTSLNFQFLTDDFGNEDLNKYSRNNDYVRFSLSGPDPFLKSKVLPALGLNFLEEKEFTYYLYAEMEKSDGVYQYSQFDTPLTRRKDDFFNLLGFDVPERRLNRYYYNANFKFRPRQNMNVVFSYKASQERDRLFLWSYRYSPQTAPIREDKWKSLSLEVSQALMKDMNYEMIFSYSETGWMQKPGDPNNPGMGRDPDQFEFDYEWEDFQDNNGNGIYDPPEPILNLFPDTATYGTDFTGPAYTFGELNFEDNIQSATSNLSDFRFNNNGYIDSLEGEPYIDLNGNGVWDAGDFLQDKNGNGVLDDNRISRVNVRDPEPFVDGDSVIGEPFTDFNGNRVYDPGIDGFVRSAGPDNQDYNHNGRHDGPNDPWTLGTPFVDRNGNGIYDFPNNVYDQGEPFTDVNGNGKYDFGGTNSFFAPYTFGDDPFYGGDESRWHYQNTKTLRGELKIFRQMGHHELKGGVAFTRLDFVYQDIEKPWVPYTGRADGGPYPNRGAFRDMFAYQPYHGTVYFRDKLEYGSMIASIGLRWDFFLQDKTDLVEIAKDDDLGSGVILGDRQKVSPRIGFSYPISDKAKVHFNYGHFYQLPSLTRMYARNTTALDQDAVVGNYNLDYQKTVQYSFGVKYAMSEFYSIDVSGYFKDEFDKINVAQVQVGRLNRQQYRNKDYGRSRGFELTIEKRGGGYVNGMLSYVYAFAFGKASEESRTYQTSFELLREPLDEAPLDNDIRHKLDANIQIFVPKTVKPRLFGLPIPNGWTLSVVTQIESGTPFTPSREYPNISTVTGEDIQRNSLRLPSLVNFDIRFTKDISLVGLDLQYILWVENVFDTRNVVSVYGSTGRADTQQNQNQIVKGGTEFDLNPANWDYGRQIRMGLEVNL